MAIGTVTKYNQFEKQIGGYGNRQWDDPTAGNVMWVLAGSAYTPSATHTTAANLAGVITGGDGAPINATGLSIDNTTTPGTTYYKADNANFGSNVTITAKYLIAVQPVTPGTYASTAKLLFYVDLNNTSGSATVSSVTDFIVTQPANGWIKST